MTAFDTAAEPAAANAAVRPVTPKPSRDIRDLLAIMAALRHPETGCSWDVAQSFDSIARYTVEEAYEVADAIARGDLEDLRDELGDLLLQVVFHARIAEEAGSFGFGDVVKAISAKLIRRHPHVFGELRDLDPAATKRLWDEIKAAEKQERARRRGPEPESHTGILSGVPAEMPALMRADRLSRKAAGVGFVWQDAEEVAAKIDEELAEVRDAVASGDRAQVAAEIGDLLFTVANLARHFDLDPEAALAGTNRKFERRFAAMETALAAQGRTPGDADLAELDDLWRIAKEQERAGGSPTT